MILDGHIHINSLDYDKQEFRCRLGTAGIDGGIIISLPPKGFGVNSPNIKNEERLKNLKQWCCPHENFYGFYWIDPLEDDALEQIDNAIEIGVSGFKIICDRFYPSDERPMEIFVRVASENKPILFHSGILWDGKVSSKFTRPLEFEILLDVPDLRFSLAHAGWPWCDEAIALYGKFLNSYTIRQAQTDRIFLDITPGTPEIYRKEVLTKLIGVGYGIENNLIFGTDCSLENYDIEGVCKWLKKDEGILNELNVNTEVLNKIRYETLKRFVSADAKKKEISH